MANETVVKAEKIELSKQQKAKLTQYTNTVAAAQATANAYLDGIYDTLEVPEGYEWNNQEMCFIKQPPKPEKKDK